MAPLSIITNHIVDLFLGSFLAFLSEDGWGPVDGLLRDSLLQLFVLKSIHLLDPVLHFFALLRQPQVQLALQLYRLLFLLFALNDLSLVLLELRDNFLLLKLKFTQVSLDFLLSFKFLIRLFLIVDLPGLLHVFLLLLNAFFCHHLLLLHVLEELILIELLDLIFHLQMMVEPLLVCHFCLPLLNIEYLLTIEQFLMKLLDSITELIMPLLYLLLLLLLGTLGN